MQQVVFVERLIIVFYTVFYNKNRLTPSITRSVENNVFPTMSNHSMTFLGVGGGEGRYLELSVCVALKPLLYFKVLV